MISIAICDNEITSVEDIENKVKIISNKLLFLANIDRFFTGIELIEEIKYGMKYDIIYLDIELDNENGIDVARKIREIDMNVLIIYITNYENFAKEAFEVNAFRFLNKPIDNILFERYFINAKDMLLNNNQYFYYKYNKINYKIKLNEIIYFESDKRKTYIVTSKDYKVCYI
ncbi:response regulator transcription factor, partial [Clostridium sp. Sa3CUN1]